MWVLFARADPPDAPYWPGRRWLAALDAVGWLCCQKAQRRVCIVACCTNRLIDFVCDGGCAGQSRQDHQLVGKRCVPSSLRRGSVWADRTGGCTCLRDLPRRNYVAAGCA